MKFMRHIVSSACLLALLSCGGGGGGGGGSSNGSDTPSASGILTDSPIGGVEYLTSSGYRAFTDPDGRYHYNPGETVTFSIGGITLGTVPASGTITPIELAGNGADAANIVTNLLILLQSLDEDGDPSDRITINSATHSAAANINNIDFTVAPATFAGAGNTALITLLTNADLPTTPKSPATALEHFESEFYKRLKGAWTATTEDSTVIIRFGDNGEYILGEAGPADDAGKAGSELGKIDWNAATGEIESVDVNVEDDNDNNGEWGFSHLSGAGNRPTLRIDGDKLILTEDDGGEELKTEFTRVVNDPSSLVGMWVVAKEPAHTAADVASYVDTYTMVFFSDGRYILANPAGDLEDPVCPGIAGFESGNYTFNAASGEFAVTEHPEHDTNSCGGLWNDDDNEGSTFTVTFNGNKSSFTSGEEGITFYRVSSAP